MTRARDLADYISTGVSDTELDVLDGVTAGTVTASKALVVDANKDIATIRNITSSGTITGVTATFTTADNSDALTIVSTDADANAGPILKLRRNSASPADNDLIGAIDWTSENSDGDEHDFLNLTARMRDVTAGSEDVAYAWTAYLNGTGREIQSFVNTDASAASMVFNEDSQDIDFRVESNGNANMLFVDGGNDRIGIGTGAPSMILDVDGSSGGNDVARFSGPNSGGLTFRNATSNEFILHTATSDALIFGTGGNNERMRIDSTGRLLVGKSVTTFSTAGHTIYHDGSHDLTASAIPPIQANRLSSDGDVIAIFKDSSQVGSIASVNGNIKVSAYGEEYASLSGTSVTVDCRSGNNFALTTSGNTTFTFSNAPTSGTAFGFTLKLTSGGSHTITYPNSVDFAGATAPDAPASGETDVLVFYTVDGGTNWYGALAIDAAG